MNKHTPLVFLLPLITLSACSEYSYTEARKVDTFQQVRRNTVDVLMVVDNSCSMGEEQGLLASNFDAFIEQFDGADVDWQIGVLEGANTSDDRGKLQGGDDELILTGADGRIIDMVTWDTTWQVAPGQSMQRSSQHLLGPVSTVEPVWCAGTLPYGDGDLGSPGEPNSDCDVAPADLSECTDGDLGTAMGDAVATGSVAAASDNFSSECSVGEQPDVAHMFTAPHTGCIRFDTAGSDHDTVLSLHTACDGEAVACSMGLSADAMIEWRLTEGQSVLVVIESVWSEAGDYQLNINSCEEETAWLQDPRVGEIVISEFMADPQAAPDDRGEWVELTNMTNTPLRLKGLKLSDKGTNSFTLEDDFVLAAHQRVVLGRHTDPSKNGGVSIDIDAGNAFTLNNNVRVLSHKTAGAAEIFAEMVAVGSSGSGQETSLQAAMSALSAPLVNGYNRGFLRDNAGLALIFVSDEDDFSYEPAWHYLDFFLRLKGQEAYRDATALSISAVTGITPPSSGSVISCESDNGSANYGARYIALAERTGGVVQSICDEDFSSIAQELGLTASGLVVEFVLSEPADPDDIQVSLYASNDQDDLIGDLTNGEDFTFVLERNAIRFELDQIPPSETWLVVDYRALPSGAQVTEETQ